MGSPYWESRRTSGVVSVRAPWALLRTAQDPPPGSASPRDPPPRLAARRECVCVWWRPQRTLRWLHYWPSRERWVPLLPPPHSRCWGEPRIPLRFIGRRGQHTPTSTRPRIGKALASGALPPRPLSHLPRVLPRRVTVQAYRVRRSTSRYGLSHRDQSRRDMWRGVITPHY